MILILKEVEEQEVVDINTDHIVAYSDGENPGTTQISFSNKTILTFEIKKEDLRLNLEKLGGIAVVDRSKDNE